MLALKKIAVTGEIASGKSTVCRFFKEFGAYVVSADDCVHDFLLLPQTQLGKKVTALLGQDVVVGEVFSREAIAKKVFNDPHLLKNLEQLIHPEVQRFIETQYYQLIQEKSPYTLFVAEVPLLFESNQHLFYDAVVVVISEEKRCRERFMKNPLYDAEEFTRRQNRLIPMDEKRKSATFLIENNGNLEDLKKNTFTLFTQITRR